MEFICKTGWIAYYHSKKNSYITRRMQQKSVIVGLIQMAVGPDPEENFKKALANVDQAARDGSQIICLPELYRTRYFAQGIGVDASPLAERYRVSPHGHFLRLPDGTEW